MQKEIDLNYPLIEIKISNKRVAFMAFNINNFDEEMDKFSLLNKYQKIHSLYKNDILKKEQLLFFKEIEGQFEIIFWFDENKNRSFII